MFSYGNFYSNFESIVFMESILVFFTDSKFLTLIETFFLLRKNFLKFSEPF